jgi:carboxyl-terminal processing protease
VTQRERYAWLLAIVLLAVLALNVPGSMAVRDSDYSFVRTLIDVQRILSNNFVSEVDDEALREAAIAGMVESLGDRFTIYVPPDKHKQFESALEGTFEGIGIELNLRPDGQIEIVTPVDDSPAFNAGILAGDLILAIDGTPTAGMKLTDAIGKIKGPLGSTVKMKVRHTTGVEAELSITRAGFTVPTLKGLRRKSGAEWEYFVTDNPKIAYVRLTQFTPDSADKLEAVLKDLLKQGMTGLIFDLRFNPGGRLDEAAKIIDLFIDKGVIVRTKGRKRPEQTLEAKAEGTLPKFNMVVLINEHSASASEVVSGSLLDNKRAVVVGTRSYGKGSVQETPALDGGGDLKVTVAYYYLPSGRLVHRTPESTDWGVQPQIEVPMDEATQAAVLRRQASLDTIRGKPATTPSSATKPDEIVDTQLARAVETLVAMSVADHTSPDNATPVEPVRSSTTAAVVPEPATTPTTQPESTSQPATRP